MSPLMMFILYTSAAFLVALTALLWGSQQKVFGAALLLGSVVLSNIMLLVLGYMFPDIRDLTLLYIVMDLSLAYIFVLIFSNNSWLRGNKWAAVLALIHLCMTGVNFVGVLDPEFGMSDGHRATLNGLMIAAYAACLIGFTPKSWDEAHGVLKAKLLFIMNDIFGRVRVTGEEAELRSRKNKTSWIDAYIGERIKQARNREGMTQIDLASILDISQAQINRLETGENRASANQLFILSRILHVDMNFFTEGLETPSVLKPSKPEAQ